MKRLIEKEILEWLNSDRRTALLLSGARQVGKTYIVREVLRQAGIHFIEFNFVEQPELVETFSKFSDTQSLIDRLRYFARVPLIPHHAVVFFDEVQAFPDLMTRIKFLADEGSFKYILSGSLLGITMRGVRSVPVGYLEELHLYPLNFQEFALANGLNANVLDLVRECAANCQPIDEAIHKKLYRLFRLYLAVGGMPACVTSFLENKNLPVVNRVQTNIRNLYESDFPKYETEDKRVNVIDVYRNIPSQLNKQNNRFVISSLGKGLKLDRVENNFLWLYDAGLAYPCFICQEIRPPLVLSKDKTAFKLFLNDVGLLTSFFPESIKAELIDGLGIRSFNEGSLYENFVDGELVSMGSAPYYYKRENWGEIDFLAETKSGLVALEVKSGSQYETHRSLDKLLQTKNPSLSQAVVLYNGNFKRVDGVQYWPIYACFALNRDVLGKFDKGYFDNYLPSS